MHTDKIQAMLIAYIDGQLTEAQAKDIEKNIEQDEAVRREYEQLLEMNLLMQQSSLPVPDERLRHHFESMLQEEIRLQEAAPLQKTMTWAPERFRPYWHIAAAVALLLIGTLVGLLISRQSTHQQEMMALQQELEKTQQMVIASIQPSASASQRLTGVLATQQIASPDPALTTALIQVLNHDDNTNVRLAALNALLQYREDPQVYEALLASLVSQNDPVVQISLINTMARFKDVKVKEGLQQIISNKQATDIVKDEARVGLYRFS